MSTTFVTSAPVIVAAPAEHPVTTNKNSMKGIGITGILIGLYAIGFGGYYLAYSSYDESVSGGINLRSLTAYGWVVAGVGVLFVIAGSLAIAAACSATSCHTASGIVFAILASLAAFGLLAWQSMMVFPMISYCSTAHLCQFMGGTIFAHVLLLVLAVVEFILAIVHASYSCACCGRKSTHPVQTAMAVTTTTYGKGYAPLHNESSYATAYPPQKSAGGPPAYY